VPEPSWGRRRTWLAAAAFAGAISRLGGGRRTCVSFVRPPSMPFAAANERMLRKSSLEGPFPACRFRGKWAGRKPRGRNERIGRAPRRCRLGADGSPSERPCLWSSWTFSTKISRSFDKFFHTYGGVRRPLAIGSRRQRVGGAAHATPRLQRGRIGQRPALSTDTGSARQRAFDLEPPRNCTSAVRRQRPATVWSSAQNRSTFQAAGCCRNASRTTGSIRGSSRTRSSRFAAPAHSRSVV
jgi:hypothetical protein